MSKETVYFDRDRFLRDFEREMKKALKNAGTASLKLMQKNLRDIPNGGSGATGKPKWHSEIASVIKTQYEGAVDGVMTQLVGLVDVQDVYQEIRAKILEYGTGSMADTSGGGSGNPIAHRPGIAGLNSEVTGYNAPFDADYYELPAGFNQGPQHWFFDAAVLTEEIFSDEIEKAWSNINPLDYIKQK